MNKLNCHSWIWMFLDLEAMKGNVVNSICETKSVSTHGTTVLMACSSKVCAMNRNHIFPSWLLFSTFNESSCNNLRVVDHLEVVALLVDVEDLETGHVVALPGVVLVHVLIVVDWDRVRFVRRLELRVLQITHIPQVSLRVPGSITRYSNWR